MVKFGTGYLYNWGDGKSGSNFIPSEITGDLFDAIGIGNNFNTAIHVPDPDINNRLNWPERQNYGNFGVTLFSKNGSLQINKLSLISTFSGTGGAIINNTGYSSGNAYFNKIIVATAARDFNINTDIAFLSLGQTLGTGSGIYFYPQDTVMEVKKNNLLYSNSDSWTGNSGSFIKYSLTGFSGKDAGIVAKDIGGNAGGLNQNINTYEINYGSNEQFISGSLVKQKFLFQKLGVNYPLIEVKRSNNKMWTSYNVESGMKNKSQNVFAYSFDFVDIVTLKDSGVIVTTKSSKVDPYAQYRKTLSPKLSTGFDSSFSAYSGYCFQRLLCKDPAEKDDVEVCYTGNAVTGREYELFISGVKKMYTSKTAIQQFDAISNLVFSSGVNIFSFFKIETGQIIYNSFFTGDTLTFNLYNFDYTGLYKSYHLGNNPLYPSTGFSIKYPNDFTDIDTLTNKLNQKLSGVDFPVWYPYECLSGEATGTYITGGLMSFYKNTGVQSGDINYNNIIKFRSLRNYSRGYTFSLTLTNRDEYLNNLMLETYRKGFSYLIPNVIELQGLTGNQWIVLDRRSGLYDSLTGLEPTYVPLKAKAKIFDSGLASSGNFDYLSSQNITGKPKTVNDSLKEIFFSGTFQPLQKFRQQGFSSSAPYCPIDTFDREISIVRAVGWPVGMNPCEENDTDNMGMGQEEDSGEGATDADLSGKDPALDLFLRIKKTGWLLQTTGKYLSCLTSPNYDPLKINFPKYRIVARDFSGLKPTSDNQYLIPKNEAYFANINLFSVKKAEITGMFYGQSKCLIGSDYVVDVQDIVPVPFYKNFEYSISGEDRSGVYKALNQTILYTPTGNEVNVKFVRSSGKIAGNVTGILTATFSGTGIISHDFSNYYFYNTGTKEISFKKTLSKVVTGSSILSGTATVIKQDIINKELYFGGTRLNINPQYLEVISGGVFTGLLFNQRYARTDVQGFYYLTGTVTGLSNSGYFNYSTGVSGYALLIDSDNLPYYPILTGLKQASGNINFDFNKIKNFDVLRVNNFSITYADDTGNYSPPSFFSTIDNLLSTINTNQSVFRCSGGKLNNTGILLKASNLYAAGDSGNFISTSAGGSGMFPTQAFLNGGKTFYPILTPTTRFSGIATNSVAATGFYYSTGSGYITGTIQNFKGQRSFTGIWDIQTGQNYLLDSFLNKNLIKSGFKYIDSGNFETVNTLLQLNLIYKNQLNTLDSNNLDVAELKIKDNNFYKIYDKGFLSSGITGELIFRITGIKNL